MKIYKTYCLILTAFFSIAVLGIYGCTSKITEGDLGTFPYLEIYRTEVSLGKEAQDTIQIPLKTNREYSVSIKDAGNAAGSVPWLTVVSKTDEKLVLKATENTEEHDRTANVELTASSGALKENVSVVQAESGIHTYTGVVFLGTNEEIKLFANEYNRIDGNLILGSFTDNPSECEVIFPIMGETVCFRKSTINSISELASTLTEITGNVYVIHTEAGDLSALSAVSGIDTLAIVHNTGTTSIGFVRQMQLQTLVVRWMPQVSDFTSIPEMTGLKGLDIASNGLTDADFLSGLQTLESLVLGIGTGETNNIYDLSYLYGFEKLAKLDISGLPVSPAEISELKAALPDCRIISNDMRAGTPILSQVSFSGNTTSSLRMTATIEDPGIFPVTRRGFRFGTDLSDPAKYEEYVVEGKDADVVVFQKTGLASSTRYYAQAFAENIAGVGLSEESVTYTEGNPVLSDECEVSAKDNYTVSISSELVFPGSKAAVYGSIIGIVPDLDTNSCTYKLRYTYEDANYASLKWDDTFTNLNSGTRYFVRSYACNAYGIVYGKVTEVMTGGNPNQNRYMLTVTPTVPVYSGSSSGNTLPEVLYATFFRNDITGGGKWSKSSLNGSTYSFTFYEGKQDLVLSNVDGSTGSISCATALSASELVKYTVSGKNGTETQLLAGVLRDISISGESSANAEMQRLTSRINLYLTYADSDGTLVEDLSTMLSSVDITAEGMSSEVTLRDDFTWRYSGTARLSFSISEISAAHTQTVAENIHVLPSAAPMTFTVNITFKDGTSLPLKCAFRKISANTENSITLKLARFENGTGGGFNIETIEEIDEEIEF